MPKFRFSTVTVETIVFDTDKTDEYDKQYVKEWGAEIFAETTIDESVFAPELRENPYFISWDTEVFHNREEID